MKISWLRAIIVFSAVTGKQLTDEEIEAAEVCHTEEDCNTSPNTNIETSTTSSETSILLEPSSRATTLALSSSETSTTSSTQTQFADPSRYVQEAPILLTNTKRFLIHPACLDFWYPYIILHFAFWWNKTLKYLAWIIWRLLHKISLMHVLYW